MRLKLVVTYVCVEVDFEGGDISTDGSDSLYPYTDTPLHPHTDILYHASARSFKKRVWRCEAEIGMVWLPKLYPCIVLVLPLRL